MPNAAGTAVPAGSLLDAVERVAWRVRLPTRRFFLVVALTAGGVLLAASVVGAAVTARNAGTIEHAREQGLGVARAATEFSTNLAAADAAAAGTLVAGGLETPVAREGYVTHLLEASSALTRAGLVGTGDDAEDIRELANGLVEYSGLVETARANARLGYPVGAAYLDQARTLAQDELVPRAERLRREGERRVARSANTVGGPIGGLALVLLIAAALVLVAAAILVAGRTRRALHPALLAGTAAIVATVVLVALGISRQSGEMRAVNTTEFDRYMAANDAYAALSSLRVTEIGAVAARGSGVALYQQFDADARRLSSALADRGDDARTVREAVDAYRDVVVEQVSATDAEGKNQAAAEITLTGDSSSSYARASDAAAVDVDAADHRLRRRFDKASSADVHPVVPLVLGMVAAVLAVAGILGRGRRYR
ncbi:MAG TPA: hypothetical protein VFI47_02050 [Acidimicrobiales bacterium]|nr:hypothetical protein [Acidimicrobiales bacterium]